MDPVLHANRCILVDGLVVIKESQHRTDNSGAGGTIDIATDSLQYATVKDRHKNI